MNEFMSRRRLILPSESIPLPYNYWEEGGSNQAILKYNSTPERLYFSGGSYGLFDAFPSDFNGLCNGSYYVNMPYKETPDGLVLADGLGNWQEIEIQITAYQNVSWSIGLYYDMYFQISQKDTSDGGVYNHEYLSRSINKKISYEKDKMISTIFKRSEMIDNGGTPEYAKYKDLDIGLRRLLIYINFPRYTINKIVIR